MEDILRSALARGSGLGAKFLDIRLERGPSTSVTAEDGNVKDLTRSTTFGAGVRALAGGSWGFAAVTLDERGAARALRGAVERAVRLAKANRRDRVKLAEERAARADFEFPHRENSEEVPLDDRVELVKEASRAAKEHPSVVRGLAFLATEDLERWYASSDGALVRQRRVFCGALAGAVAKRGPTVEFMHRTDGGFAGFERIRQWDLVEQGAEAARKAALFAGARAAPATRTRVVLDPEFVALVVHEVMGHPSEADRVLGRESAWAGRAWWADKVGRHLFSPQVTVVSDATLGGGHAGSYPFDDEGVPGKRVVHVERGVLKGFLHSRETAALTGAEASGAMRATGYGFAPLIRMTNTFLEPGDWEADEIIRDTKSGIYLAGNKVPSVDALRYHFQISAWEAYEIRNGEIGRPLRGAILRANTKEFFSSVDAAGRDFKMTQIIYPACGKGDPMQSMYVGNGGPTVRGEGMVVGPGR
ncbi:MAG: TldD/PmbA family protein [Halobacteria archaeon]